MMVKTNKKCSQDITKRVVKKKKLPVGDIQKEIKKKKLSNKKNSKKVDTGSSKKPNQKKSAVIVEKKPKNISKRQLDRFDKEFLPIHSSTGQSRFKKLKSKDLSNEHTVTIIEQGTRFFVPDCPCRFEKINYD